MSALGQKRTFAHVRVMSALPPKADIDKQNCDIRFVPKADIAHRSMTVISSASPWRRSCHMPLRTDAASSKGMWIQLAVAKRATGAPNIGHAPTHIAMPRVRITKPKYIGLRVN